PHHTSLVSPTPPHPATSTLSLHDALPISTAIAAATRATCASTARAARCRGDRERRGTAVGGAGVVGGGEPELVAGHRRRGRDREDRKSTRLNSSHSQISYAVFCLKKKKMI